VKPCIGLGFSPVLVEAGVYLRVLRALSACFVRVVCLFCASSACFVRVVCLFCARRLLVLRALSAETRRPSTSESGSLDPVRP
jgi:hypothetical protein